MIVDAHQHIWDPRLFPYPWLAGQPKLNRPRLPGDSRADGVDRVVFVQADTPSGSAEAEWVQRLTQTWPELGAIVAYAPLETPRLADELDHLATLPLFRGVRRLLQDEPAGFIESAPVRSGLSVLAERGIPFDACVRHHQLGELRRAMADLPETVVVLDHLGKPPVRAGLNSPTGKEWAAAIVALAELPSVFVKLSGLAPEADPARALPEQVAPFIDAALEVFGPDRCMAGSDWPVSSSTPHKLTTPDWFAFVGARIGTGADRERVLGGTAIQVYRMN